MHREVRAGGQPARTPSGTGHSGWTNADAGRRRSRVEQHAFRTLAADRLLRQVDDEQRLHARPTPRATAVRVRMPATIERVRSPKSTVSRARRSAPATGDAARMVPARTSSASSVPAPARLDRRRRERAPLRGRVALRDQPLDLREMIQIVARIEADQIAATLSLPRSACMPKRSSFSSLEAAHAAAAATRAARRTARATRRRRARRSAARGAQAS